MEHFYGTSMTLLNPFHSLTAQALITFIILQTVGRILFKILLVCLTLELHTGLEHNMRLSK